MTRHLLKSLFGGGRTAFFAAIKRRDGLSGRDVRAIAVHEAGHALAYAALRPLPDYVEVRLYDRFIRDDVLGEVTPIAYPHQLEDVAFLQWHMLMLLAGQAAEQMLLDVETVGPVQDLAQWTALAQELLKLCQDDFFFAEPRAPDETAANQRLLMATLTQQRQQVHGFLDINRRVLVQLASELEQRKRLQAEALRALWEDVQIPGDFPLPVLEASKPD